MKKVKRDFINSFILMFPALVLMAPLAFDVFRELNMQSLKSEPICIEFLAPNYGYNPCVYEENKCEFFIMKSVAYCACEKCCGHNTGITYSGTVATQGRTVACNLKRFPIGTKLLIDENEYIVEDTGNLSENMIDIYFDDHEDAINYGSQWSVVKVIN